MRHCLSERSLAVFASDSLACRNVVRVNLTDVSHVLVCKVNVALLLVQVRKDMIKSSRYNAGRARRQSVGINDNLPSSSHGIFDIE